MPISGIEQPETLPISPALRLRRYTDDCAFALDWYQDEETLRLVDGVPQPYDLPRLYRMYHYLEARGEVYFIEWKAPDSPDFRPVGDVAFWPEDLPIVIGEKSLRGQGIGRAVVQALVGRARELGFPRLQIREIYSFNAASRAMFEGLGFRAIAATPNGNRYELLLEQKP